MSGLFLDLNKCSSEQLSDIPGIEKSLGEAIVRYRQTHTRFNSFDELWRVEGINRTKYRLLRNHVGVGRPSKCISKIQNGQFSLQQSVMRCLQTAPEVMAYRKTLRRNKASRKASEFFPLRASEGKLKALPVPPNTRPNSCASSVNSQRKQCRSAPVTHGSSGPALSESRRKTVTPGGSRCVEVVGSPVPASGPPPAQQEPSEAENPPPNKPDITIKQSLSGKKVSLWCTFDQNVLSQPTTMTIQWDSSRNKEIPVEAPLAEVKMAQDSKTPDGDGENPIKKVTVNQRKTLDEKNPSDHKNKSAETTKSRQASGSCDPPAKQESSCDQPVKQDSTLDVGNLYSYVSMDYDTLSTRVPGLLNEENLLQLERGSARRWWDKHKCIEAWVSKVNVERNISSSVIYKNRDTKRLLNSNSSGKIRESHLDEIKEETPPTRRNKRLTEKLSAPETRTCYRLLRRACVSNDKTGRVVKSSNHLSAKPIAAPPPSPPAITRAQHIARTAARLHQGDPPSHDFKYNLGSYFKNKGKSPNENTKTPAPLQNSPSAVKRVVKRPLMMPVTGVFH